MKTTIAHQIFELARTKGELTAVCRGCTEMTFRQVAEKAVRLAAQFRPFVRESAPIAVATNDTAEMITAALATWLLRCPYLPVDPACPPQRLEHMLRESNAAVLATGAEELRHFAGGPWSIVSLAGVNAGPASKVAVAIPEPETDLDDPAYIIYTSGSTGLPKGVIVTHANLSHFAAWYRGAFSPRPADRATQFASLTFDASVFEMWPPLTAGASIWPVARGIALAEKELQSFLIHNAITHCFAPTAIAEELIGLEWPAQTRLRFLLTGADTLRRFPNAGLPFQLINNYGPTECTVLATSGPIITGGDPTSLPSIGRPIPGAQIYILDENLAPLPPGEVGEIYIGGDGVALGYVGQPSLTQERFLSNPFRPGKHMYRTGDRGRFRPDGELEFWGRLDAQLKVRGYRIEPDEIVQTLRTHKAVHVCAVKAYGSGGTAQVAVYLELNEAVTSDELREYLGEHLPPYMIPDLFIQVDRLPLSERGKIDMAALPAPEVATLLPSRPSDEDAKNEIENELALIVSQLLKRPSVNVTDNFFRLGGHSLLAAQVIARVRQCFGVDLSLRSVFEAPTVQALAFAIEQKIIASLANTLPAGAAGDPATPFLEG